MTCSKQNSRIVWMDLLKGIAIFMMIAVHCTDNVTPAERSEPWYNLWGSLYGSVMRPAIPLFVMVTGALLLPVRENLQTFYGKRLSRLIVPFLIWSVFYNLFPWFTGLLGLSPEIINDFFVWAVPSQDFQDAWHNILMIPFNFSTFAVQMWYVYLLIGLYLYMPVFSAWIRQSSAKEQQFFLALWFVSLFIPYLRQYLTHDLWGTCSWNEFHMLYYFAGFNGYLLLGHYLTQYPISCKKSTLVFWGTCSFVIGFCITFFGFKSVTSIPGQSAEMTELFYTYCSPNVLLMSLPIFLGAQRLEIRSDRMKRTLRSISTSTLGIWMSHYLFLGPCYHLIASWPLHTMVKMILCSVLLLGITWRFVVIVRRSERMGKWLMG